MKDCEICICQDCIKQERCTICEKCFNSTEENCKSECPYGGFESED